MASAATASPHRLHRIDAWAILGFAILAFVLRAFSPILPDFFAHPLAWPPVTNCVTHTPIDAKGDLGTLCGLAYPFQVGTPVGGGSYSPSNGQVFDEVYFPADAYNDFQGLAHCHPQDTHCQYNYFDPEPPLAKLLIGAGEWSWGQFRIHFQGAVGNPMDLGYNTLGWRLASLLFGSLCVPLIYLLARRLHPRRFFAIAAATLFCFDGMAFVQSRIGMIDIFAVFFILLIYWALLAHLQAQSRRSGLLTLLGLGAAIGLGVSSKWIVLAAASVAFFCIFVEALRYFWPFLDRQLWPRLGRGRFPGGLSALVYLPAAAISLVALPLAIYLASWYPFFARGQFHNLADLIAYNRSSFIYHATLTATHPFGSPWWSWPLLARPVYYYFQGNLGTDAWTGQPLVALMYNIGNPWVWWSALPALLLLPVFILRRRSFPATVIALGFITQWIPWSQVTRVTFLYHMFAGSIFMILALALALTWLWEHRGLAGRAFALSHLLLALLFFAYFYPVWTALPLGEGAWHFSSPYATSPSPPWGAKAWLHDCTLPPGFPAKPDLWCWP